MKYVKWVFGNKSNHNDFEYVIDEVNTASYWNPNGGFDDMGGFNFTTEECALRWAARGNVLYDVIIPRDAEVINVENSKTPNGILRSNKIIITNPKPITDELMFELYKKSALPLKTYYECIGVLATHNCKNTCLEVIRDKVNKDNIDEVIKEYNDFLHPGRLEYTNMECWNEILGVLEEIKSDLLISISSSKEPYEKKLTNDKIINLTGQTGSGKSTYASEHFKSDDYIIIDTDEIFPDNRFNNTSGLNKELGMWFRSNYETLPSLETDFDLIYTDIVNYCKNIDKTIVIDCAQFHCIKNINLLKGKIIIIRTDIDTCYDRVIKRWIYNHESYNEEELEKYKTRKKAVYSWYKETNKFFEKIDKL